MASLIPNIIARDDPHTQILIAGVSLTLLIGIIFAYSSRSSSAKVEDDAEETTLSAFFRFFYASFLKPHTGDGAENSQQDALESFYKAQAVAYDKTRKILLRGREDMLGLVAAQLVQKAASERTHSDKRIWIDVSILLDDGIQANYSGWWRYWMEY